MANSKLFVILSLSILFAIVSSQNPTLIIELFRHGARGPLNLKYDKTWGKEAGQLTGVGMRQHYLLGVALKDRYKHLFDSYDPSKIYIKSTDVNRTIMSAHAQLYSLFEGKGPGLSSDEVSKGAIPPYDSVVVEETRQKMSNDYALPNNVQVLPIHVQNVADYNILAAGHACPNAAKWDSDNLKDEEANNFMETVVNDLVKHYQDKEIDVKNIDDLASIADTSIANRFEQKPIPGDIDPEGKLYNTVRIANDWIFFKRLTGGENEPALHSFYFLQEVKRIIGEKAEEKTDLNAVLFSAHDSTLAPVLAALGITNHKCLLENYQAVMEDKEIPHEFCRHPVYASSIVFEFYPKTETEEASVALVYDGIAVPFCGKEKENKCTLTEFNRYIAEVSKYDEATYNKKCGVTVPEPEKEGGSNALKVLTIITGIIAAILLIGLLVTYMKLRTKSEELKEKGISLVNNEVQP